MSKRGKIGGWVGSVNEVLISPALSGPPLSGGTGDRQGASLAATLDGDGIAVYSNSTDCW